MTEFNPGGATSLSEAVKLRYEANADTNAFTDAEKAKLAGVAPGANAYVHPDHTGDVLSASDGATTIAAGVVGNGKLAPVASGTLKGRVSVGSGSPEDMNASTARTLLNVADGATANATDAALRDRTTHTGTQAIATVAGLQGALDDKAATAHGHDIADVTGLQDALDGKAAATHGHVIGDVTGLQTALDGKANTAGLAAIATTGSASDLVAGTLPAAQFNDTAHGNRAGGALHSAATTGAAGFMSGADKTKLDGVATGATANATDADLRDRATHTGTQNASTISNFSSTTRGVLLTGLATAASRELLVATDTMLTSKNKINKWLEDLLPVAFSGSASDLTDGTLPIARIADDAVTYAKMQNVSAASRLLGRGAGAGSGDPQEISIGSGLSMTGTTLSATGGGGGGGGAPAWQERRLIATQTMVNDTSAQSWFLTESEVPLDAESTYEFEGVFFSLNGTTSHGLNMRFNAISGAEIQWNAIGGKLTATAQATAQRMVATNTFGTNRLVTTASTVGGNYVQVVGTVRTGGTGGNLHPIVAQSAASGSFIIQPGTFFRVRKVGADTLVNTGEWV